MGTIADKLTYLNTTKTQLKQMISYGYPLSNETFRQYVGGVFKALINSMSDTLNPTWNNLPKITTTPATSLSINNTIEAPMRIELGASELTQAGTPTPDNPQDIHTISGSNTIQIKDSNNITQQEANIDLDTIEYCKIGNYEDKFIRNSGKNLLNIKGTSTNASITMTAQTNGIYISGTSSSARTFGFLGNSIDSPTQYFQAITLSDTNAIKLKAGTYTLSYTKNGTGGSIIGYVGDYGARLDASTSITSTPTFTITEDKYLYIGMYIANGTATNYLLENIQLEKNSQATSYEPYGSNEWYIKKNIGKVVLDGTEEGWSKNTGFDSAYVLIHDSTSPFYNKVDNYGGFCNYYGVENSFNTWQGTDKCGFNSVGAFWVRNSDSTLNTVELWKTWLSTHNLEVYFKCKPTYTQITGTLAEQLENVYKKMMSQKGQTNISQVNNDLGFVLNTSALEDLS